MRSTAVVLTSAFVVACGPSLSAPNDETKRPTILGARCDIQTKAAAPLIVDWSSAQRSRLESSVRSAHSLAVRVKDCDIEPLWQCELPGKYHYQPSSVRHEKERIGDRVALFARVPVSAVSLEARIAAGSVLDIEKVTVGSFVVESASLAENQLRGQCEGATHFISGVDVGAFSFAAAKKSDVSGGVDVKVVQAGGSKSSEHEVLSTDGNLTHCGEATPGPEADPQCRAPIQIAITPLVPSLTKSEFIDAAVVGTQAAFQRCNVEKKLVNDVGPMIVLYLVADPRGSVSARFPPPGPKNEFRDCVTTVWNSQKLAPFAGPEIVLEGTAWASAPDERDALKEIDAFYRNNFSLKDPGIPPRQIGEQIFYDYSKNSIAATDKWQFPWTW